MNFVIPTYIGICTVTIIVSREVARVTARRWISRGAWEEATWVEEPLNRMIEAMDNVWMEEVISRSADGFFRRIFY